MNNLEYLCDYRKKKDRERLENLLKLNNELLMVNVEILTTTGSNEDIQKLLCLIEGLNARY
tara:strand:- start:61 stop:243 length:183 start_codon:yes stop_codon:yes gene_type:complete